MKLGSGPAIDLQKMPILAKKKIIPSDQAHFDLGEYVTSKIVAFWTQKTRMHTLKSRRTQNESRGIIGPFFFENEQAEAVTVNGDRYLAMLNEFLFTRIEEEDIGNIWFQGSYTRCFAPCFWRSHYRRRADVVWPPRSCDLTPLDYYL